MTLFLTGSTGFLGSKLLSNLLRTTEHHLYVLVRDLAKGQRLVKMLGDEAENRITLVQGDITAPSCGLTADAMKELTGNVEIFYHLAALVKFDEELRDDLFNINYSGTGRALELAKQLRVKQFFYISTAYTVGKRAVGTEVLYPINSDIHNPYEESKVHAEHLVFSYADQMAVSIFRPSIIVGDSETGEADSAFTLYGFMRALDVFKRRVERQADASDQIYRVLGSKQSTSNLVPVNYVADILALAATKAEDGLIYNITNPSPASNYELLTYIKEALDFDRLAILENAGPGELTAEEENLNGMIRVFNAYLSRSFDFDDSNTQRMIEGTEIAHLQLSTESMKRIIHAFFN